MSNELPYFKFEPSSWDNGNIQICSHASKGLFMDICSMYWSRLGELPYALALQKHCNGNTNAMQELIDSEIIVIKDNNIIIEFLDEQLTEFIQVSEKRKVAASKRWDANAMQLQCKSNANKRRGEKRRKEKIFTAPNLEEVKNYFNENGYLPEAGERAFNYYDAAQWHDSSGKPVLSWKQKMQAVWFKPENKKQGSILAR